MIHRFKKIAAYLLPIIFSALLVVKGIIPAWNTIHSDFANYYVAAKLVVDKVPFEQVYDNQWFQDKIKEYRIGTPGKFSPFPPITAWFMAPLTPFEPLTAQRIFTIINLLFIGIGAHVLRKLSNWSLLYCYLFILGCGLGLINNIAFGQVYLIMMVSILITFGLFRKDFIFLPGIILGFFTALKYFPIVIIGGFFLHGLLDIDFKKPLIKQIRSNADLRLSFYSLSSFTVLLLLQYFYFGDYVMSEFVHSSFLPHLDGELSGQGLFSYAFQSWDNLSRNIFIYDAQFNPHPILNWPQGRIVFKLAIELLIAVSLVVTLFRYKSAPISIRRSVFLSVPALGALVLLPASASYHFVLLTSSLILLIGNTSIFTEKQIIGISLVYGLLGLIPYGLFFNLGISWGLLFAYPRLALITLLYAVVLFFLNKKITVLSHA